MTSTGLALYQIASTIRFVRGYRFLDRCGEAICQLEDVLDPGWIPGELTPKGGQLVNHELGMSTHFHSASMTVIQSEFLDFAYFRDQACKIYDVLRKTFEIKTVNAPTLKVVWQRGFEEVQEAEQYLIDLNLVTARSELIKLIGGKKSSLSFTLCTEEEIRWQEVSVLQRRRIDAKTILQEKQPTFDERLLQRARLLPEKQREAMAALSKLRQQHPPISRVAVQFEVESAFETEFSTESFDLPTFYSESWAWHERVCRELPRLKGSP